MIEDNEGVRPASYYLIKNGLLYYYTKRRGEPVDLLVISQGKVDMVMQSKCTQMLTISLEDDYPKYHSARRRRTIAIM